MLNYIWFGLIFISVLVGTITGRIDEVTDAAISMSKTSVEIAIGLVGIIPEHKAIVPDVTFNFD